MARYKHIKKRLRDVEWTGLIFELVWVILYPYVRRYWCLDLHQMWDWAVALNLLIPPSFCVAQRKTLLSRGHGRLRDSGRSKNTHSITALSPNVSSVRFVCSFELVLIKSSFPLFLSKCGTVSAQMYDQINAHRRDCLPIVIKYFVGILKPWQLLVMVGLHQKDNYLNCLSKKCRAYVWSNLVQAI